MYEYTREIHFACPIDQIRPWIERAIVGLGFAIVQEPSGVLAAVRGDHGLTSWHGSNAGSQYALRYPFGYLKAADGGAIMRIECRKTPARGIFHPANAYPLPMELTVFEQLTQTIALVAQARGGTVQWVDTRFPPGS